MKGAFIIIIDLFLMILGVFISIVGAIKWKSVGYILESYSDVSNIEGSSYIMVMLSGVVMAAYGLFDFWVFRRTRDSDKK